MLHSQWELLEPIDGVLYRRWCGKGKPDVLQLLVPATLRQDYMQRAHFIQVCVVVTSAFVEHWIKSSAEHFGSAGDAMFAGSASSVRTVMVISADSCRDLDR